MSSVLVAGSTGYVGGRLVPELLDTGHTVRCVVRDPAKLGDAWWHDRVEVVRGDVTDAASMRDALAGIDVVYYLVHSMGTAADFAERDRTAARCVADAAAHAGTGRIVYLGRTGPRRRPGAVTPSGEPPRGGRGARGRPDPGHRTACGGDHRIGVGQLRDAPLPGRGAAGDGGAPLGRQQVPADRHPRRARCAGRRCRGRGTLARGRDRRRRRAHLPRDDDGVRARSPG